MAVLMRTADTRSITSVVTPMATHTAGHDVPSRSMRPSPKATPSAVTAERCARLNAVRIGL
jgi:hypothetical protein